MDIAAGCGLSVAVGVGGCGVGVAVGGGDVGVAVGGGGGTVKMGLFWIAWPLISRAAV